MKRIGRVTERGDRASNGGAGERRVEGHRETRREKFVAPSFAPLIEPGDPPAGKEQPP